ncbi:MAG: 2-isopropylmalate synthase [Proteobacteria bacterium]|nr:2-isopropylmalate synthase [Pseudomonadota bacterium]MBU1739787.1 2-isopropylmalate synthase [Pseudomonadota bacterium]
MDKIIIFDTTLRDGEQAAGCRLGVREKLKIARQLTELGVDVIEAGFPSSSPEDFRAVQTIAREVTGATICALSRAVPADIDACGKALAGVARSRIHTGIGVSDIHILGKFRDPKYGVNLAEKREATIEMAVKAVMRAQEYTDEVEFYTEDAGRADQAYLCRLIEAVIGAGATVVNIPDTTGYAVPSQYGRMIREVRETVPNIDRATISVHCHDDLGMAVANTLAGIENGARQVEGTINGIGERAGNAALEEVIMALETRRDFYQVQTDIRTPQLYAVSRLVSEAMGMSVSKNKAIVGDNVFSHSSGIHVDGFLKERQTYEIMQPEDIGFPVKSGVVLTARTGRHGVFHRFSELGHTIAETDREKIYQRFLTVADGKQEVFDADLEAILRDESKTCQDGFELEYFQASCRSGAKPAVVIRLRRRNETVEESAEGDGPVDASYKAINKLIGYAPVLHRYEIQAVTEGTDAMGNVLVHLEHQGKKVIGRGASTDIIEASIKAYLDGLNTLRDAA